MAIARALAGACALLWATTIRASPIGERCPPAGDLAALCPAEPALAGVVASWPPEASSLRSGRPGGPPQRLGPEQFPHDSCGYVTPGRELEVRFVLSRDSFTA